MLIEAVQNSLSKPNSLLWIEHNGFLRQFLYRFHSVSLFMTNDYLRCSY